jgi:MATE family multidrug resistance protein
MIFCVPSAGLLCLEWWAFELISLFSGYFSVESLAAQSIVLNFLYFINIFPSGFHSTAACLVGMSLGA